MNVQTVKFVASSEIFGDADEVKEVFSDAAPFSWGDANHTLVDRNSFAKALEQVREFSNDVDGYNAVRGRVESLLQNTFIDLEN